MTRSASSFPSRVAIVALIVLAVFAATALLMIFVDHPVGVWENQVSDTNAVAWFRTVVQPLGREPLQFLFIAALLIAARVKRCGYYAWLALAVGVTWAAAGGGCHLIKIVVHRPRPEHMMWPWSGHYDMHAILWDNALKSFPSGDVTIAAGLATVLFLAVGNGWARYLFYLLPMLSAFGRITGAKHYPSDCLFGFFLGTVVALLIWRWVMRDRSQPTADQATPESVTTSS